MREILTRLGGRLINILISMAIGIAITLLAALYYYAHSLPNLNTWHTVKLDNEFTSDKYNQTKTFADYLKLEQKLFDEIQQKVYQKLPASERTAINRYTEDSAVNPNNYPINWNRTRELPVNSPKAACLLIHGLSDSPYSVHALALSLQQQQCWSITLRLPGHGTVPAGLLDVDNEGFQRAVQLAAQHLQEQVGDSVPFYIVGYSTGATLAIDYAISSIEELSPGEPLLEQEKAESLPTVDGIVFLSPAIGVSGAAGFAVWQRYLSKMPGLANLAWNSVLPEYDPYKYNSFTINAAEQVYDLTVDVQERLDQLSEKDGLKKFPPTITFMSAVDDTVLVDAVVDEFLSLLPRKKLPSTQHELVVYDIDRSKYTPLLFSTDAASMTSKLLESPNPFDFVLVTNKSADSKAIKLIKHSINDRNEQDTDLVWPDDLYSLSHTALPFSYNDLIYGNGEALGDNSVNLGNISLRGERNVLRVPPSQLSRLRYNPFYDFQEQKILDYFQL